MFLQVKPVRDSITEALGLWKRIGGEEDKTPVGRNSFADGRSFRLVPC